ncbi:MAG TPA: dTDP-4-dehydrorhamnose 3,5-epimerase [Myxococcota bacterium]|nr:dTDP-4-dehydrorhamnose 3,5-epimerase [Myxococcota bacterium]
MRFEPTAIPDVIRIEPRIFRDARGFFLESYHEARFSEGGVRARFVQDNHSRSARGTLRGLHMQLAFAQGKLVRCVAGEVFDVAVDVRRGSGTFGQWVGETLSAENFRQLWVPPGFLHGFCVTSETAEIEYKCTEPYHPEDELGVAWNDPDLGIRWPIATPLLSAKDATLPRLREVEARLTR